MARTTTTRSKRVAVALPLALVSVAWTTHLGVGSSPAQPAQPRDAAADLPDPAGAGERPVGPVASEPVEAPASLTTPAEVTAGDGTFTRVASSPATADIPSQALAAYQRAETVINAADPSCGLSWQLLAALGRVESDHGRSGGATIGADGVSTPAIIGAALDGSRGTASVLDTDAGQYDGDTRYDRAVGPLQFIPSTWSVVGVDADDDGERNPLDIDDAALAAAVYLCSGTDDLTKAPGQRLAVFRYNHSSAYVDQVLAIMDAYLRGDVVPGPRPVLSARSREVGPLVPVVAARRTVGQPVTLPVAASAASAAPAREVVETPASVGTPTQPVAPAEPVEPAEPVAPAEPVEPAEPVAPAEPVEPAEPAEPTGPEPATLTVEEATAYCADDLGLVDDPALVDDDHDLCVTTYALPEQAVAEPLAQPAVRSAAQPVPAEG